LEEGEDPERHFFHSRVVFQGHQQKAYLAVDLPKVANPAGELLEKAETVGDLPE